MARLFRIAGHVLALAGVLLCLLAGGTRLAGLYTLLGFESMTLYVAGIGLMVAACLARLYALGPPPIDRSGR